MTSRRFSSSRRPEHSNWKFRRNGSGRGRTFHSTAFRDEGYNDHESVCIAEDVAGISGFRTTSQVGFKGVLQQRFDDFLVHELSARSKMPVMLQSVAKKSRNVVQVFQERVLDFVLKIRDSTGSETVEPLQKDRDDSIKSSVRQLGGKLQQTVLKQQTCSQQARETYHLRQLVQLVSKEIGVKKGKEFEQFLKRVEQAQVEFETKQREKQADLTTAVAAAAADGLTFYLGGLNDKADRVFIHETMRRYGKTRIVADTLNVGSETAVIRVRPRFAVRLLPGERDDSRDWPVGQPDYLQFTLYKRNKGMTSMINQLASMLKVLPTAFSYAEVKDKRAITTQLCTVYRVPKNRAQLVLRPGGSKKLEEQPYLVGDMRYVSRKIALGECAGNRITMVIRSLPEDEKELSKDDVSRAVSSWETCGFINFFGLHRFGKTSTSYHLLGRAVLRKDYKMAVLLVLRPQEGEASKIRAVRESFRQHKDMAAALRMLPPYLVPERAVLEGLQQHGMDAHEPAFNTIPKQLRVSFVQGYQYFVWNEMASMRMAKFSSTSAVVGDLVLAKNSGLRTSEIHNGTSEPTRKRQRTEKSAKRQPIQETVELTEDNVDQYSIEDVVLPLPGHAIKYPTNEIGTAYRKMLTTDGIDLNAHFGPDGSQAYILDGSYRHVVKKPTRVSFRLERYTDPNKPLVLNDVDALLADSSESSHDTIAREIAAENASQESTEDAPYRALVLEFDLDYGVDATTAVRELLKQSGSMQVNWQTSIPQVARDEATRNIGGVSSIDSGSTGSRAAASGTKAGQGDTRKVIKAQKTTQVAIGRPGFSLGRS